MLVLLDIDGTILLTHGEGVAAFGDAGQELYGRHFTIQGVDFSGRLDALIWKDLLAHNNVPEHLHDESIFRTVYGQHLTTRMSKSGAAHLLPGVRDLVEALHRLDHVTLGVLTGNYPETGQLKIKSAGLDPELFRVAAWGCEGASRRDLPPVAMRRHAAMRGTSLDPDDVVIIGDTPHDIDCAKAHGCRSIGVATGAFSVDQLRACGADLAVTSLANTRSMLEWITRAAVQVEAG
jgi:phosphoglycolate phosphatase